MRDHQGKVNNCSNFQPNHKVIPVPIIQPSYHKNAMPPISARLIALSDEDRSRGPHTASRLSSLINLSFTDSIIRSSSTAAATEPAPVQIIQMIYSDAKATQEAPFIVVKNTLLLL